MTSGTSAPSVATQLESMRYKMPKITLQFNLTGPRNPALQLETLLAATNIVNAKEHFIPRALAAITNASTDSAYNEVLLEEITLDIEDAVEEVVKQISGGHVEVVINTLVWNLVDSEGDGYVL
jgi:hypothetical protein